VIGTRLGLLVFVACHSHDEHAEKKAAEGEHARTNTEEHDAWSGPALEAMTPPPQRFLWSRCDARETMIRFPEYNRANLRAFLPCTPDTTHEAAARCTSYLHDTTECWVHAGLDNDMVLAPQPGGGYLLDVRASMRKPDLRDVAAQLPESPVVVRVMGTLATTNGCMDLIDGIHVHACTTNTKSLDPLKDGLQHTVTVALKYPHANKHTDMPAILVQFLGTGFDETAAEHAYDVEAK
jgi:hypothetical protein